MNKTVGSFLFVCVMFSIPGYSAGVLDTVCVSTFADSMLSEIQADPDTAIPDSVLDMINNMTVSGTCDSATISTVMEVAPLPPITVTFMTMEKVNSCSLSITFNPLVAALITDPSVNLSDTVIDVCAMASMVQNGIGRLSGRTGNFSVRIIGTTLVVNGLRLRPSDRMSVRLLDANGRTIRTISGSAGSTMTPWQSDATRHPAIAVIQINGTTVGACRVGWVR